VSGRQVSGLLPAADSSRAPVDRVGQVANAQAVVVIASGLLVQALVDQVIFGALIFVRPGSKDKPGSKRSEATKPAWANSLS
jgi:hypothetical protein